MFVIFFLNLKSLLNASLIGKKKCIQFGWGGEYRKLNTLFQSLGINHHLSCPHTHQQNNYVVRKHRQMVVQTSLLSFLQVLFLKLGWIFSYCYLSHQPTSIPITNDKSPRELLFHQNRDYNFLKVYGCACLPQQSQIGFLVQTLYLSWL